LAVLGFRGQATEDGGFEMLMLTPKRGFLTDDARK
jgi:hypothetical protein